MSSLKVKVFNDAAQDTTAQVNEFLAGLSDSKVKHVNSFRNPVGDVMQPAGLVMYVVAYLQ
jgi:hypothetical protein